MSRIVMSRITSHIVLLAAAVMAASAVALASPAFAHGGGGNSSHGMGRDMGPGPVIIGQTTKNTMSGDTHKHTDRSDRQALLKQQLATKIGGEVQALLVKDALFKRNGNTSGQVMIINQLKALSRLAAGHGINETIAVTPISVTIGKNVGGQVVFNTL